MESLDIGDAWRLSKTPYVELVYRSALMARGTAGGGLGYGRSQSVKSITRGALVGKLLITVFIAFGTVLAFSQYFNERTPAALVAGVTFSLAISLGYVIIYSLQVLPSFSAGGPYSLLSTLPLGKKDISLVAILSVIRTFDSIIAVAVITQVGVVVYLTGSPLAAAAMVLASGANSVFGVAISLWLAGLFQRNVTRGGRGKGAAALRFVFLISWGLAAASIGFIFSLVGYAFPALESGVSGPLSSTAVPMLFSLVHPFSAGIALASIVFPTFGSASEALSVASSLAYIAMAGYILLAYFAGRKALSITFGVSQGQVAAVVRQRATDFLVRPRKPVRAYIVKDARIASKNPSTAFVFAMPVLETVIIVFSLGEASFLGTLSVLTSTSLGCFFTLVSAAVLLNTEGSGLEYTFSLPLTARVIITAKSAIATMAYLSVPAAIGVLLILEKPSIWWLVSIPLVEILAVSAATSAELAFFIRNYKSRGGRQTSRGVQTRGLNLMSGGDLVRLFVAFMVAGGLVLGPLATYGGAYLLTQSHGLSVGLTAGEALAEFLAVQSYLRR